MASVFIRLSFGRECWTGRTIPQDKDFVNQRFKAFKRLKKFKSINFPADPQKDAGVIIDARTELPERPVRPTSAICGRFPRPEVKQPPDAGARILKADIHLPFSLYRLMIPA
ncbi:hypothetical protein ACMFL9_23320 [Sinorhizobium meliloti]